MVHLKMLFFTALILVGVAGAILFFPMQLDGKKFTCLYHRLWDKDVPVNECSENMQTESCLKNVSKPIHAQMLNRYLHGYAFFWWTSIFIGSIGAYGLRKRIRLQRH